MWPFHKTPDQQVEPFDITQAAIVDRLTDIPSHWVEGPEYINPRGFGERSLLIGSWIEKPNYVAPTDNSLSVLQNVGNISARTVFQVTCSYEPGSKSAPLALVRWPFQFDERYEATLRSSTSEVSMYGSSRQPRLRRLKQRPEFTRLVAIDGQDTIAASVAGLAAKALFELHHGVEADASQQGLATVWEDRVELLDKFYRTVSHEVLYKAAVESAFGAALARVRGEAVSASRTTPETIARDFLDQHNNKSRYTPHSPQDKR